MSGIGRTVYRHRSASNIYHLTTRGVAQQVIFEDEIDRVKLFQLLGKSSKEAEVEIYAWCFMSNHLHLIVRAKPENISLCMIKALSPYARHFNRRHNRCGHLFQERFASSPIDSDEYLMTAVRYVHLNPVGKNTESAERTLWSSYREYIDFPGLAATEFVLDVFGGLESFVKFHQLPNNDQLTRAYEFEYPNGAEYLRDDHAIREAKALLGVDDLAAIGQLDKETRNNMLAILKARFGIQRTVRLTGIGRNIIQRACPKSNESFKTG